MKEYKSVIITCIAGICAIIGVLIGTGGLKEAKLGRTGEGLSATGSASVDFESDLAVWRGSFSVRGNTSREAYREIEKNADLVKKYFEESSIRFIMGEQDIDTEWEKYKAEYLAMGGEAVRQSQLKMYNENKGTNYTFRE